MRSSGYHNPQVSFGFRVVCSPVRGLGFRVSKGGGLVRPLAVFPLRFAPPTVG